MASPLHVLTYGPIGEGACDSHRFGMYRDHLEALGVEMRSWGDFNVDLIRVPFAYGERVEEAARDGFAIVDRAPIDWADVIVFRRWYGTTAACNDCDTVQGGRAGVAAHCAATLHMPNHPDRLLPLLLETLGRHRDLLRGRAIVYEMDDNLLADAPWHPFNRRLRADRPSIERMLRLADLVTVATPTLAAMASTYNTTVRVVRNAVDPTWYADHLTGPEPEGDPRIVYTGTTARIRDYEVCRKAVDALVLHHPTARRVWLGSDDPAVARLVDEARPYVKSVPGFARALVDARPQIGVAPVVDEPFDRAQSELRWLHYTMAGAATIAGMMAGGGPYDMIKDGVDGLLAGSRAEWQTQLDRLAGSRDLRAELVGHARERVLAEYTVEARAGEWNNAYRWAAEHGRTQERTHGRPTARPADTREDESAAARQGGSTPPDRPGNPAAAESAAALTHRQRARDEIAAAPAHLEALRAGRDVCWPETAADQPLVSIVIALDESVPLATTLATIGSARLQSYRNVEILLMGAEPDPELAAAIDSLGDQRCRLERVAVPGPLPDLPAARHDALEAVLLNAALGLALGAWTAPLPAGALFTPDHVAVLLEVVIENRLEFVYGQAFQENQHGGVTIVGAWPPDPAGIVGGTELVATALRDLAYDPEAWREGDAPDWSRWRLLLAAGVRMANIEHPVIMGEARLAARAEPVGIRLEADHGRPAGQASREHDTRDDGYLTLTGRRPQPGRLATAQYDAITASRHGPVAEAARAQTSTIAGLAGRHAGETCHIVGRGPSLLRLTPDAFGPGPVIAINLAILAIRELCLPNPVYAMQKDSCVTNDIIGHWAGDTRACPGPCGAAGPLALPVAPETLLASVAESPFCFRDYPRRYLFDVERDFGLTWWTMSAPIAVLIASLMGCTSLVMLGHDAYTVGDARLYEPDQGLVNNINGYAQAGAECDTVAAQLGMAVTWVRP